jgi:alpha-tubulin suppressor-like RCC1 family protein
MRVLPLACIGVAVACSSSNGPSGPPIKQEGSSAIVAGNESTCLVTQSGTAYCWGFDTIGALGTGASGGVQLTPAAVAGNHTYSALSGAEFFRCGLAGAMPLCWGQTLIGASRGYLYSDSAPTLVTLGIPALATIATGPSHACGLTRSGTAFCWGENYFGQLGAGDTLSQTTAVPVTGGFRWMAITVGFWHTCALTADSTAFCWGENLAGELAAPPDTVPLSTTPRPITGYKFTSLAAGSLYTCGLTAAGAVYCWGWNYAGNLGDSTTTNRTVPTPLSQSDLVFKSIFASSANSIALTTCGITISNSLYCWGWGGYGQLGNPSAPLVNCDSISTSPAQCSSLVPFPVAGGLQFATASIGTTHACGVTIGSAAYCWGMNDHGQLGDGSTIERATPVAVSGSLIAKEITRSALR